MDSFGEGVIRRTILQGYQDKEYFTIDKLHKKLQDDKNFPKLSKTTLYRIMKRQLKFKFLKFHDKPIPFERNDISAARHKYLRAVRKYRHEDYKVNRICYDLMGKIMIISTIQLFCF